MKKILFILISLAILAVAIVSIIAYKQVPEDAQAFFENVKEEQRIIAEKQVDSLFVHGHTDIFPIYSQCISRYVRNDFWGQTGTMFRKELWDTNLENCLPKDVVSTYHVAPENVFRDYYGDGISGDVFVNNIKTALRINNVDNDNESLGIRRGSGKGLLQSRWALGANENWGNGTIVQYIIIPYAVSFRRRSYGSADSFISVDDALDDAYKFYTENDKSILKRNLVSDVSKFSNGPFINNEYYSLEKDSDKMFFISTIANCSDYSHYMYNDYFYVFVRSYGEMIYHLTLKKEYLHSQEQKYIETKRNCIVNRCLIWGSILLILWIVFLMWIIWEFKQSKLSVLQKIIIKCNPSKFVKQYNSKQLKSANEIYSKAIAVDANDETAIMELVSRAENELGVFLFTKNDIKALKVLCNPKQFMKPYDPEKVEKANELYGKLGQEIMTFADYLLIKKEIEQLYNKKPEDSTILVNQNDSSI